MHSMTGYGRSEQTYPEKIVNVEIKSLNSRVLDIKLRTNYGLKEYEMALRRLLAEEIVRGKVDVTIHIQLLDDIGGYSVDKVAFAGLYRQIQELSSTLNFPQGEITPAILRIQGVVQPRDLELSESEWEHIRSTALAACAAVNASRAREGAVLSKNFEVGVKKILALLDQVTLHEPARTVKVRERLQSKVTEHLGSVSHDANRFEQEIVYYIEKMDLTEERVRLEQHCNLFLSKLKEDKAVSGKSLSFISQEMGREINTLGAKANDHEIQYLVVQMKDELEKIKEQQANIL